MDAKEQGNAIQEGVDKEEVSAKEEEVVKKPRKKQRRTGWKIFLLIFSIISMYLCFRVYRIIYRPYGYYSSYPLNNHIFIATSKTTRNQEIENIEPPNLRITRTQFYLNDETYSLKEAVADIFPRLQTLQSFSHNTKIVLFINYETSNPTEGGVAVFVPWKIIDTQVPVQLSGGNYSEHSDFSIEVGNYNSMKIPFPATIFISYPYRFTVENMTALVIPDSELLFPTGQLMISFNIEGRVSYPESFSKRIISLVIDSSNDEIDNPYRRNIFEEGDDLWFFPVAPEENWIILHTNVIQNIIPISSSSNSLIPIRSVNNYGWIITPDSEEPQFIEFEDRNLKSIENSAIFYIGIFLSICLEVIINFLWEKDKSKL